MHTAAHHRKLIGRLRLDAMDSPRRYRRNALLVSLLPVLAMLAFLAVCAGLVVAGLMVLEDRLLATVAVVAGLLLPLMGLHLLHVELPAPEGFPAPEHAAPKLWELLDKLRHKLNAPRIDEVLLVEDFTVRIEHFPRWGWFGPAQHVLVLGLPWLMALSPKQAAAGIAHEYARYGSREDWRYAWVQRCRSLWPRYMEALPGAMDSLRNRLLARYANYMNAYTLPLAGDLTIRADIAAARCVGPERAAQAIVRSRVMSNWLNAFFWPEFMRHADDQPAPERMPFQSLITALRAADQSMAQRRCYMEEMQRKRQVDEVDPPLNERLRCLSQKPELTGMPECTAAEHLLGKHLAQAIRNLDEAWMAREQPYWRQRHEAVQGARLWLDNMGSVPDVEIMNLEALTQYARALLTVGRRADAMAALSRAANHPQGTVETAWSVAQIVSEHDEAEALPYLDLVIERDAMHAVAAAELALSIAERHGRRDRVGHYKRSIEALVAA